MRLSEAWTAYRDRLLRRCTGCGEWAYDQDDCAVCASPALSTAGPVREHHHRITREYADLLNVADATCRAHDEREERIA